MSKESLILIYTGLALVSGVVGVLTGDIVSVFVVALIPSIVIMLFALLPPHTVKGKRGKR